MHVNAGFAHVRTLYLSAFIYKYNNIAVQSTSRKLHTNSTVVVSQWHFLSNGNKDDIVCGCPRFGAGRTYMN